MKTIALDSKVKADSKYFENMLQASQNSHNRKF